MKLKCVNHLLRVVVLDSGRVVHRNADGSVCRSPMLQLGPETFFAGHDPIPPRPGRVGQGLQPSEFQIAKI